MDDRTYHRSDRCEPVSVDELLGPLCNDIITFLEALWILPVWTDVNRAVHCTELRDQSNLRSKSLI